MIDNYPLSDNQWREISEVLRSRITNKMEKLTCFIMPVKKGDLEKDFQTVRDTLKEFYHKKVHIPLIEVELRTSDLNDYLEPSNFPDMAFQCLCLDTGSSEKVKDKIKIALWKSSQFKGNTKAATEDNDEILHSLQKVIRTFSAGRHEKGSIQSPPQKPAYSLLSHGFFIANRPPKPKDIQTHSFDHGGGHFYRYRLANKKINRISPANNLFQYLKMLFSDCPNHFFKSGPRISSITWPILPTSKEDSDDMLPHFAKNSLISPRYKNAHDNVEVHLLEKDLFTIAVEIPVWLEPQELMEHAFLFSRTECLTGHIDVLRFKNNKIEIWDYKPKVRVNDHAGLQVLLYAIALSKRTGIPLTQFKCGYFDNKVAYSFYPTNFHQYKS